MRRKTVILIRNVICIDFCTIDQRCGITLFMTLFSSFIGQAENFFISDNTKKDSADIISMALHLTEWHHKYNFLASL